LRIDVADIVEFVQSR